MEGIASLEPINLPPALFGAGEWENVQQEFKLAPQEARVIALILEGKADKQITANLHISYGTLRTYLSRAFLKTGANGRVELAMMVNARVMAMRWQKEQLRG